jgi:hypothetical protein
VDHRIPDWDSDPVTRPAVISRVLVVGEPRCEMVSCHRDGVGEQGWGRHGCLQGLMDITHSNIDGSC